jgi:DNA-binding transcriptional ArsR family regulator
MDDIKHVDDPEQLKALSDPRRHQIIKMLVEEAHSVNESAEKLGSERNQLNYHLSELERLELVARNRRRFVDRSAVGLWRTRVLGIICCRALRIAPGSEKLQHALFHHVKHSPRC